jgi:8-oxo-dGTP pyrophosphatase MutT (NUDIX family)
MIHQTRPKKFNPKFEGVGCFFEYNGKIVLLHRQSHKPEGNTWGIPSGKKKKNETINKAMLRELYEETGYPARFSELSHFKEIFVKFPSYDFIYHIFHLQLGILPKVKINPDEHKAFTWATPDNALKMNLIEDLDNCIKLFYGF